MAKYSSPPPVTGTIGPLCIYQMYGRYFLRSRSSLTGKRVKTDPAFRETMRYAGLLAKASRIAANVYATLPAECRQHVLYRKLTGEAMTWLKYGWEDAEVLDWLQRRYTPQDAFSFCQQVAEIPITEEEAWIAFKKRHNRRILRALRMGDFSVLKHPSPV